MYRRELRIVDLVLLAVPLHKGSAGNTFSSEILRFERELKSDRYEVERQEEPQEELLDEGKLRKVKVSAVSHFRWKKMGEDRALHQHQK